MVKIKRATNQQNLKIVDLHFVKSENFRSLEVVDRQRDTTSSERKLQLSNLAVKHVKGFITKYRKTPRNSVRIGEGVVVSLGL